MEIVALLLQMLYMQVDEETSVLRYVMFSPEA